MKRKHLSPPNKPLGNQETVSHSAIQASDDISRFYQVFKVP